jgi:hypothetical protein
MTDPAPTMATTADLRVEIVRERGGEANFSAVQMRLTYALALALADPKRIDPSLVAQLIAQLPPCTDETDDEDVEGLPFDPGRLSGRQLNAWIALDRIARGLPREKIEHKPKSRAWHAAFEAAELLDACVEFKRGLSDTDHIRLVNCFSVMISALRTTPYAFWRPLYGNAPISAEPPPPVEPLPENLPQLLEEARSDNVVKLSPSPWSALAKVNGR